MKTTSSERTKTTITDALFLQQPNLKAVAFITCGFCVMEVAAAQLSLSFRMKAEAEAEAAMAAHMCRSISERTRSSL